VPTILSVCTMMDGGLASLSPPYEATIPLRSHVIHLS
jgi:hypothetical protein